MREIVYEQELQTGLLRVWKLGEQNYLSQVQFDQAIEYRSFDQLALDEGDKVPDWWSGTNKAHQVNGWGKTQLQAMHNMCKEWRVFMDRAVRRI